jgi:hypothetical protein
LNPKKVAISSNLLGFPCFIRPPPAENPKNRPSKTLSSVKNVVSRVNIARYRTFTTKYRQIPKWAKNRWYLFSIARALSPRRRRDSAEKEPLPPMGDWIEKNIFALFAFACAVGGYFVAFGRLLNRIKELEKDNTALISQMDSVRDSCSGLRCSQQQNECAGRFLSRKEFVEYKRELEKLHVKICEKIDKMDERRESARGEMTRYMAEISSFMGEMKARMDMEDRR